VNASNREADFRWIKGHEISGSDVRDLSDDYALIAVQGPKAIDRLGLAPAKQFTFSEERIDGVQAMVNRTGYTGEDGVEILCMAEDAVELWDAILARGVTPCGLGARDSLRLEASLPLHGNDIGPDTDAIEAGLAWTCALDKKDFTGADVLRRIKEESPARKLISFVMEEKAVPRQGMPIVKGGVVTSGSHSPMLDVGIGMGYVPSSHAAPDTGLTIDVRGKLRRARVVKRPIYKRED
jgi:aminomethyltransferase